MAAQLSVRREDATETHEVVDGAELLRLLDQLHEHERGGEAPPIALLELASGDVLGIGLGRDETVLSFTQASGDPPYVLSRGASDDDAQLVFFHDGHWTEFSRRNAVGFQAGRDAMVAFLASGQLTDAIEWEEA